MSTLLKTPKTMAGIVLVLLVTLASGPALAEHRDRSRGHHSGANARFSISIGVPLHAPRFHPAPYPAYTYPARAYAYPAPAYVYPAPVVRYTAAPVYVERSAVWAPPAPANVQNDWYYCAASGGYYPYVSDCASGWERVPAQAASR
jgi:hypothetical protein